MSLQILIQQLISEPNVDKTILIQIIKNLVERIDKLESNTFSKATINIIPPKESYTEFIQHIEIPKIEHYLNDLPKLLTLILTDWLNKENIPIILHKKTKLYIYITDWRPLVNNDLNNLYNYIVKQITIQLSNWQKKQQDNIIKNEQLYETYSKFILNILSNSSIKIKLIKKIIIELLIIKTPS